MEMVDSPDAAASPGLLRREQGQAPRAPLAGERSRLEAPAGLVRGIAARDGGAKESAPGGRYKRVFDIAVIAVAFIALLPVWMLLGVVIPVAIWMEDRRPALYAQRRLGRAGRTFRLLKYRTMVVDAERQTGPVLAAPSDHRVTTVGRILRRFHLDELPQVVNILAGDMSLVGPRPERPELTARWRDDIPGFSRRLRVRPGIAGLAQARASYHAHPRDKLRYDELYIAAMSPWLDLKLLFVCVWRALRAGVVGGAKARRESPTKPIPS